MQFKAAEYLLFDDSRVLYGRPATQDELRVAAQLGSILTGPIQGLKL